MIQNYNFSNLPSELNDLIVSKLDYKTYTAFGCCSKKFNEIINRQPTKIAWPIIITPIKELKGVYSALHHLGCDIIVAVNAPDHGYDDYFTSIYELGNGHFLADKLTLHEEEKDLELGLDYPFKGSRYEADQFTHFLTDCHRNTLYNYEHYLTDKTRNSFITMNDQKIITFTALGKTGQHFHFEGNFYYVYSEKKGYLFYEKIMGTIVVHDVDSNTLKASFKIGDDEEIVKYIYNEDVDHLVFYTCSSSCSGNFESYMYIYEVSSGKLLKRFLMNSNFHNDDLLLYLPKEGFVITTTSKGINKRTVECLIYDLNLENLVRRIPLKENFLIKQFSYRNNSLYITQYDSTFDKNKKNGMISRIDFFKPGDLCFHELKKANIKAEIKKVQVAVNKAQTINATPEVDNCIIQ